MGGNDVTRSLTEVSAAGLGFLSRTWEVWWTRAAGPEAIAARAMERSSALIRFARAHSPFYRAAWKALPEAGLTLASLPVVTKHRLMARFDDWVTDRSIDRAGVEAFLADRTHVGERFLDRFVVWRSSGSTGEPGIFVQDANALAVVRRAARACSSRRLPLAARSRMGPFRQRRARRADRGDRRPFREHRVLGARLSRQSLAECARVFGHGPASRARRRAERYQPAFLASYPTTLALLAEEQRMRRLRIAPTSSGPAANISRPRRRQRSSARFDSVLVNEYGASECMSIAFSCPSRLAARERGLGRARDRRARPPADATRATVIYRAVDQPRKPRPANRSLRSRRQHHRQSGPVPLRQCVAGHTRRGSARRHSRPPVARRTHRPAVAARARHGGRGCGTGHRFQLVQTGPETIAVRLPLGDRRERDSEWHATQRALHAYLVRHSLDNVHVRLDRDAPLPDPRSGKLREVIADLRA